MILNLVAKEKETILPFHFAVCFTNYYKAISVSNFSICDVLRIAPNTFRHRMTYPNNAICYLFRHRMTYPNNATCHLFRHKMTYPNNAYMLSI